MTVQELINKLEMLDRDALVVMSKDSEGNGFLPLCSLSSNQFSENESFELDRRCLFDTDEADVPPDAVPCVTLWPV